MDTPLTFILGSVSSLGLIFLGINIYLILKINKRITELEKLPNLINLIEDQSKANFKACHHSIDSLGNILSKDMDEMSSRMRSYTDSRFDKLITSISNELAEDKTEINNLRKMIEDVASDHSERLATLETHKKIDEDKIEQINS